MMLHDAQVSWSLCKEDKIGFVTDLSSWSLVVLGRQGTETSGTLPAGPQRPTS